MISSDIYANKPTKFAEIYRDDDFSKMRNFTFTEVCELMKDNDNRNCEEIFIRQKVDGVSCLLVLSLCKQDPGDNCVFVHEDMKNFYTKHVPKAGQSASTGNNTSKMHHNAWHPYMYNGSTKGWFYVHVLTSFGTETEPMSLKNICQYQPLYLPGQVLFQLHRDIAGWPKLNRIFDNIELECKKKRKNVFWTENVLKFLVFRCELALPGMQAFEVTTEIVNSWRHPGVSRSTYEAIDPDETIAKQGVTHARHNFQIYILKVVFSDQIKQSFIKEMLNGFKKLNKNTEVQDAFSALSPYTRHCFSRDEFIDAMGFGKFCFSPQQLKCSQDAFFLEELIAHENPDTEEAAHVCYKHGWIPREFEKSEEEEIFAEGVFLWCRDTSRGPLSWYACLRSMMQCYRGTPDMYLHMPVITTPFIYYHGFKWSLSLQNIAPNLIKDHVRSHADRIMMLCQHINNEGAVVSCKHWDTTESRDGSMQEGHYKLKDTAVCMHMPYLACEKQAALASNPGNWYDCDDLTTHFFPPHGDKTSSKHWPDIHIDCYGSNRKQCNEKIREIKNQIHGDSALTSKAKQAILSEIGVLHSASKITWLQGNHWHGEFDSAAFSKISKMPCCSVARNWRCARPFPVHITSIQDQDSSYLKSRMHKIMKDKERYFTTFFQADMCTNIWSQVNDDTQIFAQNQGEIRSLQDIFETKYSENILQNIFTTMCLQVHMRYMLLCSANDDRCKNELWDLWCCGSKVLKQMFCTDLRYWAAINKSSQAQYRPADWPVCAFLHRLLQKCRNMQSIHDVLFRNFTVKFQEFKRQESKQTSPAISNKIFDTFEKVVQLYIKYLNKRLSGLGSTMSTYALLENVIIAAGLTHENQLKELEQFSEEIEKKTEAQKNNLTEELHKKWKFEFTTEKNSYKFYSSKMIKDWIKFRSNNKTPMSDEDQIEPSFDYYEMHHNIKNRLHEFLTEMSSHYTLFSTLHGVLASSSTVFQFDPVLVSDLATMKQNQHVIAAQIYKALEQMHPDHPTQYKEYIDENKAAVALQNEIEQEMQDFYKKRCKGRITAHPTSIDNTNRRVFTLLGVDVMCKVFANWHFGDLGDDARVECKQLK
tara:strand:+ start:10779 stop:14069 length:3291 start_codon:yes stop_codon:yes gene_type:complete